MAESAFRQRHLQQSMMMVEQWHFRTISRLRAHKHQAEAAVRLLQVAALSMSSAVH